jgi:AraC-like DNA-binding protein
LDTKTTLLVISLAIGALQGIIYGIILLRNKTIHKTANRFLAAILFFFSYRLTAEILFFFGLGIYDIWYYVLLEFDWIYGALIYFFTLSYVNSKFKLHGKHLIHFLPVIIEIGWSFFIKTQNLYWDGTRESLSWLGYWGYVAWMHYPTRYIISGLLIIFYSYRALEVLKNPPIIAGHKMIFENTNWIRRVILALAIFSILFTTITLIDFLFFDYAFNFFGYPIFIIMAIITYWLGIEGFSRRNIVAFKEVDILSEKELDLLKLIAEKIRTKVQQEKLYKNPELTVAALSEAINEKPYLVAKALTVVLHQKFSDYINKLRFDEVKSLLSTPENDKFTLLSIAFEAGFNSKASFNRTVLKYTGKSPKHLKTNT